MIEAKQTAKIVLAWELFEQHMPKGHIATKLEVHRETIREWIKGIKDDPEGMLGFLQQYEQAKKGPRAKRKVDGLLKARIYRLREENRQSLVQNSI